MTRLAELRRLDVYAAPVTDLAPLRGLGRLEWLGLYKVPATDFTALAQLTKLEKLDLGGTAFADTQLLASMHELEDLYIDEPTWSTLHRSPLVAFGARGQLAGDRRRHHRPLVARAATRVQSQALDDDVLQCTCGGAAASSPS